VDLFTIHQRAASAPVPLRLAIQIGATVFLVAALALAAVLSPAQEQPQPAEQQPAAQASQAAESAPPAALVTLQGVVRNAATGQPLPRALVRIEGEADTGALTDGEGRFEIPGVPVGSQTVSVRKPGFHDRPYASEDVDSQEDGPAHSVLVAAGMSDLNFTLSPTSAIHGRIELSTGDPAEAITLTLLKQVVRNGRAVWTQNGTTKTNGAGAYRFAGLPGGVYALFTQPAWESEPATAAAAAEAKIVRYGYPSIFYPEARQFSDATHIRLKAGQQAEANLLLTLEPFYTVIATPILPNGRPLDSNGSSESASNAQFQSVLVLDAAGRQLPYTGQADTTTHNLRASLPDGAYTIFVGVASDEANASVNTAAKGNHGPALLAGFAELSIDGHGVANLRIPLSPAPSWPIPLRTVRTIQAGTPSTQAGENLVAVTATYAGDAPMGEASADSTSAPRGPDLLEMNGVGPGPHWISTEVNDRSLCVDSFTAGGINLAREPLNVALGASPPSMELTLRDDCATLALTLPPMLAAFLPGDEPFYTVYVVPDFDTTTDIPPMNVHPSSGATLNVNGLTPGSYHVYTFDRPVRLEYRNPEALTAQCTPGQSVTLAAGTTSSLMLEVPQR
jgi:hypothetical protein